jgi:hypothetical protein
MEALDGHQPAQTLVLAQQDLRHPAKAERPPDPVAPAQKCTVSRYRHPNEVPARPRW